MTKTVAIFGPSCSGKTAVGTALAARLGVIARSCGEIVRQRAAELGISPAILSDDEHVAIDTDTRSIAANSWPPLVIEGTFLDHVLAGLDVVFIQLYATTETREQRHREKAASGLLSERDASDDLLRRRLYADAPRTEHASVVDTTALSIEEVVQKLVTILE